MSTVRRVSVIAALAAASIAATYVVSSATPGPTDATPRIIDGSQVPDSSNPGAVYAGGCTASLIAPEWVLTARHCVEMGGRPRTVGYGSVHKRTQKQARVTSSVTFSGGDIALLKLAQPITDAPIVKLADTDPQVGAQVDVYGWGSTTISGNLSPTLKTATMKYTEMSKDHYGGSALEVRGVNGTAWKGDSGGPALVNGVQVGVLSTGSPRQRANWYASVAHARSWIKQNAGV